MKTPGAGTAEPASPFWIHSPRLSVSSPSVGFPKLKPHALVPVGHRPKGRRIPGSARLSLVSMEVRDGNDPVFGLCFSYAS